MTNIADMPRANSSFRVMAREFFLWAGVVAFAELLSDTVTGAPITMGRARPFIVSAIVVALFGAWRRLKSRQITDDLSSRTHR